VSKPSAKGATCASLPRPAPARPWRWNRLGAPLHRCPDQRPRRRSLRPHHRSDPELAAGARGAALALRRDPRAARGSRDGRHGPLARTEAARAEARARRRTPGPHASITSATERSIARRSNTSCSTKPTRCSTWAFARNSRRSSRRCPPSVAAISSRRPSRAGPTARQPLPTRRAPPRRHATRRRERGHRAHRPPGAPERVVRALVNVLLLTEASAVSSSCAADVDTVELAERLAGDGFVALPLSGDLAQGQRTRTLNASPQRQRPGPRRHRRRRHVASTCPTSTPSFTSNPPSDAEMYTHRSGRTGRPDARDAVC